MPAAGSGASAFVVVDVETTGLWRYDRIVEIGCATLAGDGSVIDEWSTLVNPMRDVSGEVTAIHGLSASDLSAAPTFAELAPTVAALLSRGALVAHNASFDVRMLRLEFERLGASLTGEPVCTMAAATAAGARYRSLLACCTSFGIDYRSPHHALSDALAAAAILRHVSRTNASFASALAGHAPMQVIPVPTSEGIARTSTRLGAGSTRQRGALHDVINALPVHPELTGAECAYLALLDYALADFKLTADERTELAAVAAELELEPAILDELHGQYVDDVVRAALRDDRITIEERAQIDLLTSALGLQQIDAHPSELPSEPPQFGAGTVVCFTGDAPLAVAGEDWTRVLAHRIAERVGMIPAESVTKKCQLVVAGDPSTMSGKAKKARSIGVPVIGVDDYLKMVSVPFERY